MIHLNNLDLAFAGQHLFNNLSWHVKPSQRIGLVGPNGAGKTTLLRVIAGKQEVDAGTKAMASATTIGYLEQDVQEVDVERTVLDEAMQAFAHVLNLECEVERLTQEMDRHPDHESPAYHKLLHQLERVQIELAVQDAYRIQSDTETVLAGLGFETDDMQRPLETFSGGWRMRVALAKLLLQRPDLLLLDEPTNHLDIESIDWLENYLNAYPGTVILVSHDRYFLDRMVTTIVEMAYGQVTEYAGNYAYYLTERTERRQLQQAAYENQQRYIKDIERFIERFRYKATKAKQVQSRIKALERLERIPPAPKDEATIHFRFPEPSRSGRMVMEMSTFSKSYQNEDGTKNCVFNDAAGLTIERGDKIALIGKNGAGKSTLARMLQGNEPFEGIREMGYQVEMAHFAQHQAESLNPRQTVLEALQSEAAGQTETQIRSLLGAFLFRGDAVFKPISVLSGGERNRVALAKTLLSPANFLILDEPTNHLDMQSKSVLVEALKQYTGTFVLISHDRYFLDQVANQVWYAAHQKVRAYPGTYSDFTWALKAKGWDQEPETVVQKPTVTAKPAPSPKPTRQNKGPKTKEQKRLEAEARNRRHREGKNAKHDAIRATPAQWKKFSPTQLRSMIEVLEDLVEKKEKEKSILEAHLSDPAFYNDVAQSSKAIQAFSELEAELKKLYKRWEAIASHIEYLEPIP